MILSIQIKNFALIKSVDIDFSSGLNVITGETGSGKSIILSSLRFVLGEKPNPGLIRLGEDQCEVSMLLKKSNFIDNLAKDLSIELTEEYLLRRTLSKNGSSKCYLNSKLVPVSTLRKVGENIVFCSQFENQRLLDKENVIEIIDLFSEDRSDLDSFKREYKEILSLEKTIEELRSELSEKDAKLDYYKFIFDEIEAVDPKENEDLELEEKIRSFKDLEKLKDFFMKSESELYGSNSIISKIETLASLSKKLPIDNLFNEQFSSAIGALESLGSTILGNKRNYLKTVSIDELDSRLSLIKTLKRKYGGSISQVIKRKEELGKIISRFESLESDISSLEKKVEEKTKIASILADSITDQRTKTAKILSEKTTSSIRLLNMSGASVDFNISNTEKLNLSGKNEIRIDFTPNKGEKTLPLEKIASGGELSRVTLALYQIIGKHLNSFCFIFDEIDTGIGGETATSVGRALSDLSKDSQIVSVSHLPQIAESADSNILIEKIEELDRTRTTARVLDQDEKKKELSRMRYGYIDSKRP